MGKKCVIFLLLAALMLLPVAVSADAQAQGYEVGYAKVDINPYWHAWMEWSKDRKDASGNPIPNAGTYPYQDFYEPYDMLPLPMSGYGTNESRLSRPKLMDDNGSGVGASKVNVTKAKTSATATSATTLSKNSFYSYVYANNPNYQDVHLSSNRYTKAFAQEMGVTYEDGIYGENDGDGVWSTCVLVKDPQTDSYLMVIGVDVISLNATLDGYIRKAIMEQPEIKALGLTEDRILINANHTHGSVSTGTQYSSTNKTTTYTLARNTFKDNLTFTEQELYWYLNFYKNYLCSQLAVAAVKAAKDLEPALTMEKGTIDAGLQTGHHMNGVRHNVQTYTPTNGSKPSITYVRGSSFNNYMRSSSSYDSHFAGNGFTASKPVSESDDKLHILKFTFENKAPIAMVNFRAHSTANNKEAAKALHYNISADWVSPLRLEMEKAGYRFTLLYGNSGNLGTGVASDTNSPIPYNQAYYSSSDGYWVLPATNYGRLIAQSALALLGHKAEKSNSILDALHPVPMGALQAQKTTYLVTRQQFSPLSYAAALSFYNAGSPASGGRYTIKDGATVTNAGKSITLKAGEGGTFVIASKYHANAIVSRYGVLNKPALELNTIRLGKEVAFYTTPLEAADRYFTNTIEKTTDIVAQASKYNDWWNLNEPSSWGTPFDLSLTNGSGGYITNELAYDYGKDYKGTDYMVAIGCYESQNSNANRGEGEKIVAVLNDMLRGMESKTAYCSHCQAEMTFRPLSMADIQGDTLSAGHYFLASNFDYQTQVQIKAGTQVCLDLNGFTYNTENYTESSRALSIHGTLNVMDLSAGQTGKIQALGVKKSISATFKGGTVYIPKGGTVNLYSGTLTQSKRDGYGANEGGVVSVYGSFHMYGGSVADGTAADNGGNIYVNDGGKLLIHGGSIEGGTAAKNGGNIFVAAGGKLQMDGGSIVAGRAEKTGATTMGGNVYCNGTFLLEQGSIRSGYAHFGGNVQIQGAGAAFTMRGGSIEGGTAGYKTDVADLCTGQASTETGHALFRMEGGYIETAVYSQGDIILTGSHYTDVPMRVVVKEPGDRLVIEGKYTGNIQLVLNDANYLNLPEGAKVGNAVNANMIGAAIDLPDYPGMTVAVQGDSLVLCKKPVVLVNGTAYGDVAEAVSVYNAEGGQMTLLMQDLCITGLSRDLHLDLNGKHLASVDTGSYTLYCKDSATDDFSDSNYGTLPLGTSCRAEDGYLDVRSADRISFHRYEVAITHVNVRPDSTGIYYSCVFRGDEVFRAQAAGFGVAMRLDSDTDWQQMIADPNNRNWVGFKGSRLDDEENTVNGVLVSGIMKPELSDGENASRGQLPVHGISYVTLRDGRWLFSDPCSYSLRSILEQFDGSSQEIPDSVLDMYKTYEPVMSQWDLNGIAQAANE